jgi:hypothetical protein
MISRLSVPIMLVLGALFWPEPRATSSYALLQESVPTVGICDLQKDPAKYNQKLVKITGFISHGFEDFAVFDPSCDSKQSIWLEYGGKKASDTMYCCGVVPGHTRKEDVSVEGVSIPMVDDEQFQQLNALIKAQYDRVMHATLIGRFFPGEKQKYSGGEFWSGYGHMGCCMLFVIQQVLFVDAPNRSDLDYGASADQPNVEKVGCGYRILSRDWKFNQAIDFQRQAESGERAWALDDPARVAREALAREKGIRESDVVGLKRTREAPGRQVYTWQPQGDDSSYMVVVSRPYTLSFYAQDSRKVSWIPIAAYKVGCDDDNTVTTYKLPSKPKPRGAVRH